MFFVCCGMAEVVALHCYPSCCVVTNCKLFLFPCARFLAYAWWQQVQLTDIKALKETQEKIQIEVDRLAAENNRLAKNIDEMSETVQDLKDVENALDVITQKQGQSVDALKEQVAMARQNLERMEMNLQGAVLNNLIDLISNSDVDGDSIVDAEETDGLLANLQNMSGVEVDVPKFRAAIVGKEHREILSLVRNLLDSNIPNEEKIIKLTH